MYFASFKNYIREFFHWDPLRIVAAKRVCQPVRLLIPEYISIDRNKNRRAIRACVDACDLRGCVGATRAQIDDGRKKGGAAPRPLARARLDVGVATPSWMKHQQSVASRLPPSHRCYSPGVTNQRGLVRRGIASSPR